MATPSTRFFSSPTSNFEPIVKATCTCISNSATSPGASAPGSGTPQKTWREPSSPATFSRFGGKIQVFQGALQIILSHIEGVPRDQVEPEDFIPQSSQNVAKLTARLRELLFGMKNPHLRALAECFLIDEAFLFRFTSAPAGDQEPPRLPGGAA